MGSSVQLSALDIAVAARVYLPDLPPEMHERSYIEMCTRLLPNGMLGLMVSAMLAASLSTFIGMTTDSRSLLSFVRHDYFRRLFCRWIAGKIAVGDFPDDIDLIKPLLERVSYLNSKEIFK